MLGITHHYMDDQIVTAGDEERETNLRHLNNLVKEAVDRRTPMFRQFDHQQRLEADTERLRIDLDVRTAQDVGIAQPPDTLVGRRGSQADLGSDLLDGEPSIVLQEAENGGVRSVKPGGSCCSGSPDRPGRHRS